MTGLNSGNTQKILPHGKKNCSVGGWWDKYSLNPTGGNPLEGGEKLERGL